MQFFLDFRQGVSESGCKAADPLAHTRLSTPTPSWAWKAFFGCVGTDPCRRVWKAFFDGGGTSGVCLGLPPTAPSGWVWKYFSATATLGCLPGPATCRPFKVGVETFFGAGGIGVGLGLPPTAPSGWVWKYFFGGGGIGCRPGSTTHHPFKVGLETFFGGGGVIGVSVWVYRPFKVGLETFSAAAVRRGASMGVPPIFGR